MVERIVDDIDEIVRAVRFHGCQATHAGEHEVKRPLRKTLFKYKLHQDAELFGHAYGYIRESHYSIFMPPAMCALHLTAPP